jgi:hypothetical protein
MTTIADAGANLTVGGARSGQLSPLMQACYKGYTDTAKWIADMLGEEEAKRHALRRDEDENSYIVLMDVCYKGHTDTAKWIAGMLGEEEAKRALSNDETPLGDKALSLACSNGHTDTAKWIAGMLGEEEAKRSLRKDKGENGERALMCACYNGHTDTAKWIAGMLGEEEAKRSLRKDKGENGHTALLSACYNGHTDTAKWIAGMLGEEEAKRALRNGKNWEGDTALSVACDAGHTDTARWIRGMLRRKRTKRALREDNNKLGSGVREGSSVAHTELEGASATAPADVATATSPDRPMVEAGGEKTAGTGGATASGADMEPIETLPGSDKPGERSPRVDETLRSPVDTTEVGRPSLDGTQEPEVELPSVQSEVSAADDAGEASEDSDIVEVNTEPQRRNEIVLEVTDGGDSSSSSSSSSSTSDGESSSEEDEPAPLGRTMPARTSSLAESGIRMSEEFMKLVGAVPADWRQHEQKAAEDGLFSDKARALTALKEALSSRWHLLGKIGRLHVLMAINDSPGIGLEQVLARTQYAGIDLIPWDDEAGLHIIERNIISDQNSTARVAVRDLPKDSGGYCLAAHAPGSSYVLNKHGRPINDAGTGRPIKAWVPTDKAPRSGASGWIGWWELQTGETNPQCAFYADEWNSNANRPRCSHPMRGNSQGAHMHLRSLLPDSRPKDRAFGHQALYEMFIVPACTEHHQKVVYSGWAYPCKSLKLNHERDAEFIRRACWLPLHPDAVLARNPPRTQAEHEAQRDGQGRTDRGIPGYFRPADARIIENGGGGGARQVGIKQKRPSNNGARSSAVPAAKKAKKAKKRSKASKRRR